MDGYQYAKLPIDLICIYSVKGFVEFISVIVYRPSSASSEHSHCSSNTSGSRLSSRKTGSKKNQSSERKVR